jgi:hypothetical protein
LTPTPPPPLPRPHLSRIASTSYGPFSLALLSMRVKYVRPVHSRLLAKDVPLPAAAAEACSLRVPKDVVAAHGPVVVVVAVVAAVAAVVAVAAAAGVVAVPLPAAFVG